ncbi:hypothetical protein QFC24_004949 [Naganishia onofrii]|uniref:Uncharacterized protein n=1 Tax=Naganishia onofrii TaxID=1851511 RepID=A0ACC2XAC0_9TREE|nr:hypothetical protein QFC24_004949 [Naganishia onofrii]
MDWQKGGSERSQSFELLEENETGEMDGAGEQAVRGEFAAGAVATLLASLETIDDIVEAEVMNFGGRKGSQEDSNEPNALDLNKTDNSRMPKLDDTIAKASRDAEYLRSHTLETAYAETVTKEIKEVAEELWPMILEAIEKNKRLQEFRTGESKHVGLEVDGQWVLAGTPYLGSLSQNMLRKVKLDDGTIVQKWFLVFAMMIALNKLIETEMKRYKESGSKDEPILSAEAPQQIGQPYNKDNKEQCWGSVVPSLPLRASPVSLVLKSIEYSSQQITRRSRDEAVTNYDVAVVNAMSARAIIEDPASVRLAGLDRHVALVNTVSHPMYNNIYPIVPREGRTLAFIQRHFARRGTTTREPVLNYMIKYCIPGSPQLSAFILASEFDLRKYQHAGTIMQTYWYGE